MLQQVDDALTYLVQRLRRAAGLLGRLDDVHPEHARHRVADLALVEGIGGALELRHHLAGGDRAEIAAELLRAVVLRVLPRQLREVGTAPRLGDDRLRLGLHLRQVLALGPQQDVAGAQRHRLGVAVGIVAVVPLDVVVARGERLLQRRDVDQHEAQLPLFRHRVVDGVLCEQRGDVSVGGLDALAEVVGPERDGAHADRLAAANMLPPQVLVGHRDPVGHGCLQPFQHQRPADVLLELRRGHRRRLQPKTLDIGLFADELAVLLKRRERDDAIANLLVGHRHPEPLSFLQRCVLVDHLLKDLPVDPHRPQDLGGDLAVGLRLIVPAAVADTRCGTQQP